MFLEKNLVLNYFPIKNGAHLNRRQSEHFKNTPYKPLTWRIAKIFTDFILLLLLFTQLGLVNYDMLFCIEIESIQLLSAGGSSSWSMAAAGGGLPRLEKTTLGSSHSNHGKFRRSQKKLKNAGNSNAGLALLDLTPFSMSKDVLIWRLLFFFCLFAWLPFHKLFQVTEKIGTFFGVTLMDLKDLPFMLTTKELPSLRMMMVVISTFCSTTFDDDE